MEKRVGRKRKTQDKVMTVIGVAWYRREQWDRLLEIAADRDQLEGTYDEWKANAEAALPKLVRSGILPRKIDVDVEELLRWCHAQKCPGDGSARSFFTAEKLREDEKGR